MYSPIMWANPNELKHLQEKRKKQIEQIEVAEIKTSNDERSQKPNVFDTLFRSLAISRLF